MNAPDQVLSKSAAQWRKKPATYADLEAVPPHLVAEIIEGELVVHPRPAPPHSAASSALGGKLSNPFQFGEGGPGGWVFLVEPELHFGPEVVVPDLAGWRRHRLLRAPEAAYLEIAPDWLCEVISPSTEAYDRGAKRRIYGEVGVGYLWLLNPISRLLEVFTRGEDQWRLFGTFSGAEEVSAPPFEVISFSLRALWPFDAPGESVEQDKAQT